MTNTQGKLIKRFYWVRDGDQCTFAYQSGQQQYLAQVRSIGSTEWDFAPELRLVCVIVYSPVAMPPASYAYARASKTNIFYCQLLQHL
ncbi:hypothetical protein FD723_29935 [Nostoc sp. C052]|uniref:hypothetical protein n=1 Tax=Nostoc sp. C052 TaxID=2576902 RepID=UPI0015C3CEF9|nr:hypothetical protein [Nostoc sp. C052]QLE44240.1 hypothetical protein FD723_29935 [Nostoc sp. C052]